MKEMDQRGKGRYMCNLKIRKKFDTSYSQKEKRVGENLKS